MIRASIPRGPNRLSPRSRAHGYVAVITVSAIGWLAFALRYLGGKWCRNGLST